MDFARRVSLRTLPIVVGLALVLAAAESAAGTASASFRVGLHVAEACTVESSAARAPTAADRIPLPQVSCALRSPSVITVTREMAPPAVAQLEGTTTPIMVVTLVF